MAVENNVYLAKLAEQAERYEGEVISPPLFMLKGTNTLLHRNGRIYEERGICRSRIIR